MADQTYDAVTIARTQLETALDLWRKKDDLFSVITLAGAAEEIIGKRLADLGIDNSMQSLKKAMIAIGELLFEEDRLTEKEIVRRINFAKNSTKHLFDGQPVCLDLEEEASDMLSRAIDNYWLLLNDLTPEMERFERSKRNI